MSRQIRAAIAARFAAAEGYDAHASVQRRVARRLAQRIAAVPLPERPTVLEIGCGTGLLGECVLPQWPAVHWLATDLSPAMVARCRRKLGGGVVPGRVSALAMDGSSPALAAGSIDLVCSSMAMQWFADPAGAVRHWTRLLRPGGAIAIATLLRGSLAPWYAALAASGIAAPLPPYPDEAGVRRWFGGRCELEIAEHQDRFDSARAFARSLKAIGAHGAPNFTAAMPTAQVRAALRRLGSGEVAIPYRVAMVIATA